MTAIQSTDEILTPAQLEERRNVPKSTQAKWRHRGSGPRYFKVGSRVYISLREYDTWLARHIRRSTSDMGEAA